ncbi:hypothetical protein DCCM_3714 [Desulfocucumis palustris]|uniref:Uncharacterized protein n=1 Tax=Desulfocucumis palustris TaxID=1898651 RepID=A0A2L2XED6_9FIRM|nr:hypothetical protein DCCM_3714 [Desulfocucumis palustris]
MKAFSLSTACAGDNNLPHRAGDGKGEKRKRLKLIAVPAVAVYFREREIQRKPACCQKPQVIALNQNNKGGKLK